MNIETIAIIGASELGCRVGYAAARAGLRIILEDISAEALEQGIERITRALETNAARSEGRASERKRILGCLGIANCVEDACREADLILETVADEEEMKLELFTIFDKFAKPGAIFATTTKSIPVDDLAEMTFCADRCVGMRFFPASTAGEEKMELLGGRATSDETLKHCREFGWRMGMEVTIGEQARAISTDAGN